MEVYPNTKNLIHLLQRGIGIHHSRLLPMLKEIVEILFGEGKCWTAVSNALSILYHEYVTKGINGSQIINIPLPKSPISESMKDIIENKINQYQEVVYLELVININKKVKMYF